MYEIVPRDKTTTFLNLEVLLLSLKTARYTCIPARRAIWVSFCSHSNSLVKSVNLTIIMSCYHYIIPYFCRRIEYVPYKLPMKIIGGALILVGIAEVDGDN